MTDPGPLLRRNPAIVWRDERPAPGAVPGPDDAAVTLIDGGMMHQLNMVGATVWRLADGTRTLEEITGVVAELFDAPADEVAADVAQFAAGLIAKGWIERV